MKIKNQAAIVKLIKKEMPYLRKQYGVDQVALFGSFARNEAAENSDIDIVVSLSKPLGFDFIKLAEFADLCLSPDAIMIICWT